jgi:hypothetical protein
MFNVDQQLLISGKQQMVPLVLQRVVGGEAGVVVRPKRWPVRLAASFSSPLSSNAQKECGDDCPAGFVMPQDVALPWEVRIGAAYRFSARPFNPVPVFPKKKKNKNVPRQQQTPTTTEEVPDARPGPPKADQRAAASQPAKPAERDFDRDYHGGFYILVAAEVGLTGGVEDAIGTDALFEQVHERAGESLSVSPRLGLESEVWRRRLRLRAGTYWEPSRFEGHSGRMHGTFAIDVRLFDFSLFIERSLRFSSAVDLASRYSNLLFSIGFWH